MEKTLTATFKTVDSLEQAAEALRRQGVLNIQFDQNAPIQVDFQAVTQVHALESSTGTNSLMLEVCVEKSRYRQAEDTILKYGGEF